MRIEILNKIRSAVAAAAFGAMLAISPPASASHHFESMLSQSSPASDLLDVYVFVRTVWIYRIHYHYEPPCRTGKHLAI